jgi:RNA polymerase sigma-B factor
LAELTSRYLPLARRLAGRYQAPSREREDLDQVASLALVQAIERFDPARGTRFASFAIPTILGELRRHFREHAWAVRVPRSLKENVAAVRDAIETLSASTGRQPTVKELAEASRLDVEEVLDALEATSASDPESLDAGAPESGISLGERVGGEDPGFELIEYAAAVAPALREMDDRDRAILHLRFVDDLTQSEIAKRLGLSQMHVSRLLRRAVTVLRHAADDGEEGVE